MITVRKSQDRGHFDHGWLDTYHTFSFSEYQDPRFMGYRDLRVINEDRVAAGEGFGKHGHRDMEIVTYVLEGQLEHKDSLGTGSVLRPGDVQRMSAGRGVQHSEFNHSKTDRVHLLQIWIHPAQNGIAPGYEEKRFAPEERADRLRLIVSPDGQDGSLRIHQDARIFATVLSPGREVAHSLPSGRHAWIQVARGAVLVNGERLVAGDGAAADDETSLRLAVAPDAGAPAEVLVFDLP